MYVTSTQRLITSSITRGELTARAFAWLCVGLLLAWSPCATATTIAAAGQPTISSFKAADAAIIEGASTTLSWTATDAVSLSISPTVGAVKGTSVAVFPKVTTIYVLTATNTHGRATAAAIVTVHPLPKITKFAPSRAKSSAGATVALAWTVTNATSLSISPGVGTVIGASGSVNVAPQSTTTYTLTATSAYGTATASATVEIGSLPIISSFTATRATLPKGQSTTLTWAVANIPNLTTHPLIIDQAVGKVTGSTVTVSPKVTTTYTLTATNDYGSVTAKAMITVGVPPVISSFGAAPAGLLTGSGQSSTLSWSVSAADTLSIDHGAGTVTGTWIRVTPVLTTQYTLTAQNVFGTSTAKTTVTVADLPVINSFFANPNIEAGPGVSGLLIWTTTGATSATLDNGVGTVPVTASNFHVNPTKKTTYTLTATNAVGSTTATVSVGYRPLVTVNGHLYYSEHCVFIVPVAGQVTWSGEDSYGSVYSEANVASYVATLKAQFPDDYILVVVAANKLTPNAVPNVLPRRHMADGIGEDAMTGLAGVPDICRYNIGSGTVIDGCFGVLDHEIGHVWGVFLGMQVRNGHGHWFANSTATGQMAEIYSDDNYTTFKRITGDPTNGFRWESVNNITANETETFSEQDLYLQGFGASFPDMYVLDSPVYNADNTVTCTSATKYDQAWVEKNYGVRNPDYRSSQKRFRVGFVYVARDLAEVQAAYQPIERSINQFANGEAIDTTKYRFQVPFLVDTQYRASIDARLADLDGNTTPTLSITGPTHLTSTDGSASIPFVAWDPGGSVPVVSVVPASANCTISNGYVVVTGLTSGAHFLTIKAQNAGGKKCFAHCVIDVQ